MNVLDTSRFARGKFVPFITQHRNNNIMIVLYCCLTAKGVKSPIHENCVNAPVYVRTRLFSYSKIKHRFTLVFGNVIEDLLSTGLVDFSAKLPDS